MKAVVGCDNGLLPGGRQHIIATNTDWLLIGFLGIKYSAILIEIHLF